MGIIETAISVMEMLALDDSHGYDQAYRWGQRGDFDCSAAVIFAWRTAGLKLSGASYTGDMREAFLKEGFSDVTGGVNLATGAGLKRGDVLLNIKNHTAMYCGNGNEVEASINEFGGVTGGTPGDQTGAEFCIRPYRNYPWNCILRYTKEQSTPKPTPVPQPDFKTTGTAICMYDDVKLRAVPAGSILGSIGAGNRFEIDGQVNDEWTHVKCNGVVGWVYRHYVIIDKPFKAVNTAVCTEDDVNIRTTPDSSENYNIICAANKGHRFEIDGVISDGWYHIKYKGDIVGWMYGTFVDEDNKDKIKKK